MPTGNSKACLNESDSGPICPAGSFATSCKWVGRLDNAVSSLRGADCLVLRHPSSHRSSHSPVPEPWPQQHADLAATGRILSVGWLYRTAGPGNCFSNRGTPVRQSACAAGARSLPLCEEIYCELPVTNLVMLRRKGARDNLITFRQATLYGMDKQQTWVPHEVHCVQIARWELNENQRTTQVNPWTCLAVQHGT